jgi:hypothetical protein
VALLRAGARAETSSVATALDNLSVLHAAGGRTAAAQAEQEQSEAIMTKLYGTRRPLRSKAPVLPVWQQQDI